MKLIVLRKMAYESTFIYIIQFQYAFQYLFVWNNEIYQQHVFLKPELWRRVLWRLGFIDTPYTKDMLDQGEQVVLSGAIKSIDVLKNINQDAEGNIEIKNARIQGFINDGLVAKLLPIEA